MTTGATGVTPIGGVGGTGGTGAVGATGGTGGTRGTGGTGATGMQDPRLKDFKAPEKYVNEGWAKEVKSIDDLWDKMNGVQKLIGKDKVVLPGDNATQDEIAAFQIKMGRPEKAEGYEFNSIEALKDINRNADLDTGMKKIFFDEGISKTAGERIVAKYEELIYDMHKPTIDASAKRDMEFQTLANEVLGEEKAPAMEAFKTVMRESLGDKAYLASKIEGMDNDTLMPLILFSKNIHDKYTGENRVGVKPGDTPGMSGDIKTDFQSLSQQKIMVKTDKNMPEHIRKMKLANLNLQMTKIGTKARDQGIDLFSEKT